MLGMPSLGMRYSRMSAAMTRRRSAVVMCLRLPRGPVPWVNRRMLGMSHGYALLGLVGLGAQVTGMSSTGICTHTITCNPVWNPHRTKRNGADSGIKLHHGRATTAGARPHA